MGVDIMVLNTAVADFRSEVFSFADDLVGPGGLAKCQTQDMPPYCRLSIGNGSMRAGHHRRPRQPAPLMARAGLRVAVGVNLAKANSTASMPRAASFMTA